MKRLSAMIAVLIPVASWALLPGDALRGKDIHDAKCVACHVAKFSGDGSSIYTRADRKTKTVEGLMKRVEVCNQMTNAGLTDGQQADLVKYLSEKYYKFQ